MKKGKGRKIEKKQWGIGDTASFLFQEFKGVSSDTVTHEWTLQRRGGSPTDIWAVRMALGKG